VARLEEVAGFFQAYSWVSIQVGNVTFGYHSALNVGAKDVNFFLSSPKHHGGKTMRKPGFGRLWAVVPSG
jgi:hypothetical protein